MVEISFKKFMLILSKFYLFYYLIIRIHKIPFSFIILIKNFYYKSSSDKQET